MKRVDSLTGVRGIAALWVVFHHLYTTVKPLFQYIHLGPLPFLPLKGYLGVDLFFILSGFIISYVHLKDFIAPTFSKTLYFLGLRLARIMPMQWATLFCFLGVYWLSLHFHIQINHPEAYSLPSFIYNLLNIQAWGLSPITTWNSVAWSVSAEWFAYLLFPLIAIALLRWQRPLYSLTAVVFLFIIFIGIYQFMGAHSLRSWLTVFGVLRAALEFTMGACLFNLFKQNVGANAPWDNICGLVVIAILLLLNTGVNDIAIVALYAVFLYGLSFANRWMAGFLSSKPMIYLGTISFSIYMVHMLVLLPVQKLFGVLSAKIPSHWLTPTAWLIVLFVYLGIIAVAHVAYHMIEDPSRKIIRKWLDRKLSKPASHSLNISGHQSSGS